MSRMGCGGERGWRMEECNGAEDGVGRGWKMGWRRGWRMRWGDGD